MADTMTTNGKKTVIQFVKYALVGVMNTLVTLIVIYVTKSFLGIKPMGANAIGYVCGLINSFIWNKRWVFRSQKDFKREAVKFMAGFGLCYALQFVIVWVLTYRTPLGAMQWEIQGMAFSGYAVATLAGNIGYTATNFIYNRMVTFK